MLKRYLFFGFIFVSILGTLFHFVYQWSGNNFIAGFFFPINESTWEHTKLAFFPMVIYTAFANKKLKFEYPCITSSLYMGILLSTFLIPVIYYTYTGILGFHIMFLDILTFFISILITFVAIYKTAQSCTVQKYESLLRIGVFIIGLLFLLFTYFPPKIGLFTL